MKCQLTEEPDAPPSGPRVWRAVALAPGAAGPHHPRLRITPFSEPNPSPASSNLCQPIPGAVTHSPTPPSPTAARPGTAPRASECRGDPSSCRHWPMTQQQAPDVHGTEACLISATATVTSRKHTHGKSPSPHQAREGERSRRTELGTGVDTCLAPPGLPTAAASLQPPPPRQQRHD